MGRRLRAAEYILTCIVAVLLCGSVGAAAQGAAAPGTAPPPQVAPQTNPQTNTQTNATTIARDANGGYVLRRNARLVVLDVVVTDSAGHVVPGLQQSDFTVTEDDDPQTVLHFEPAGANAPDPNVTINSTADLDRVAPRAPVTILLLDEFNTRFEDMAFARYSLKKYLEKQPAKLAMPTMLIAVSLKNITVLHDYTQDRAAILDSLDHHFSGYPWQLHQIDWIPDRFGMAFATLMRVAEASEGHAGHKNMIWIGRGFPALDYTRVPIDAQDRVESVVQQCVNMLRDARVTLYSIDPAGVMVDPGEYGPAAAFNDPFGGNYQFSRLAKATGGRALYSRNDVDAAIGSTVEDGEQFYTLTYRPTNSARDPQKFRKIHVTLREPGLTATTREGYYLELPPNKVNPEKPSRRLAFDLMTAEGSTMVYDAVPLTLDPDPARANGFTVRVPARALVWSAAEDGKPRVTEVVVMTSTFDAKGKELSRDAKIVRAAAPMDVPPTGRLERGLNLEMDVPHSGKAVRARFVVRVSATGRMGTADAMLGRSQASAK